MSSGEGCSCRHAGKARAAFDSIEFGLARIDHRNRRNEFRLIIVMSQIAKPAARQQVVATLSQIIGLPLTAARRAADMRTFQFGTLRPVERGSVGDFALHVQCPWRIEGPDGIVTGRLDLWEPVEENAPFDEDWDYEKSDRKSVV